MNKTMTSKLFGAALMAGGLLGTSAQAAVLIDFGRPDNETTGATDTNNNPHFNPLAYIDPLDPLNRTDKGTWDSGVLGLVDTSNAATGWSIQIEMDFGGEATVAADVVATHVDIAGFEQTAWEDSMFVQTNATFSITGLNDALTYDLLFYGSRSVKNPSQTWSITKGSGGGDVTHGPLNNITTVVDWDGISTDGNGEIEFTITSTGKQSAINFGQITEAVPEPSSLALIGLGGLCVLRRRRR